MGRTHRHNIRLISVAAVLAVVIFLIDLSLPLGVAGGVPYVAVVLIGWWIDRRQIFLLALVVSALTVAGYLYSPEGGIASVVLTNRFLALFAIWVTAALLAKAKTAETTLKFAHDELETRVEERTQNLSAANRALEKEIAERQSAEAALHESEARFRDYAETGADWFWETDMDQRFTSCIESDAATVGSNITIGRTRDEVQRRINAEPNLAAIIAEYMAKGDAFRNLEFRCDDPKLGTRWTRVSGKPVRGPDGRLIGYRGSGRDVTAEVAAQIERAKTAELLQFVFEHMAEGVSVADADLNMVAFNPLFLELLDFPRDLFEIGDPFEKFIRYNAERGEYGPGDPDEQVRDRVELARRFEPHCLERTRPDGGAIEIRGNPLPNGGFVTTYTDITERKAAEEALRQKTAFVELSKSVAAAANEALSVEDALQTCVSEVCTHFGWPIGHVYLLAEDGTDELAPSTIWHLTDREKFRAFCSITMATRLAPGIGLPGRILVSREPVWIADVTEDPNFRRARASENIGIKAAFGVPVLVGSEVVAVLEFFAEEAIEPDRAALEVMAHIGKQIGRVIERARAERQLLAAKDTAERADRAKGEFLATISHELRTPLNAIIGFSEIMGQELFGPMGHPNYKEYTQDIRTSGTHLLNIINDILDVSRAQAGMIVLSDDTVDLAEVVETCLRLLGPQAEGQGLSLEADLAPTTIRVRGDRQRLSQVLLNLLSNAIKFTADGNVTVRLRGDREMGVVLEVIDTGIGIAEHDLERVMEPFTQVDSTLSRAHQGTGLGLPLSRLVVELHDGTLTIESTFGQGTVATVRLPGKRVMGRADAA